MTMRWIADERASEFALFWIFPIDLPQCHAVFSALVAKHMHQYLYLSAFAPDRPATGEAEGDAGWLKTSTISMAFIPINCIRERKNEVF